jgi:uncharacterized protein
MTYITRRTAAHLLASVSLAVVCPRTTWAAESPLDLTWKQLIPSSVPAAKPKNLFGGAKAITGDINTPPPTADDQRWMSAPIQGTGAPAPIVTELDGKSVRIGGYVVPLDFNATKVKEFLLVPFVGACIHVPPPPANQIIYVKLDKGFEVAGMFDPVTVTGKLSAAQTFTGLAETGYSIDAVTVEPRTEK